MITPKNEAGSEMKPGPCCTVLLLPTLASSLLAALVPLWSLAPPGCFFRAPKGMNAELLPVREIDLPSCPCDLLRKATCARAKSLEDVKAEKCAEMKRSGLAS